MMNEATMEVDGEGNIPWSNLPVEVLLEIFTYFKPNDVQKARLICKPWHDVLALREFEEKFVFVIKNCIMSPYCPPWSILMNSSRKFLMTNIRIGKGVEFADNIEENALNSLWNMLGANVEWIHYDPDTDCDEFMKMFRAFQNLKSLECREAFLLDTNVELTKSIENLKILGSMDTLFHLKQTGIFRQLKSLTTDAIELYPPIDEVNESVCRNLIQTEIYDFFQWTHLVRPKLSLVPGINLLEVDIIKAQHIIKMDNIRYISNFMMYNLADFSNLLEVEIQVNNFCINFHEKLSLPTVKKLQIYYNNASNSLISGVCLRCLSCIFESVPNYNSCKISSYKPPIPCLTVTLNSINPAYVRHFEINALPNNVVLNCPKLESIFITTFMITIKINSIFFSAMPNLKTIVLECPKCAKIPFDQFLKFMERAPNVKEARLGVVCIEEIRAIQSYWQNIETLSWKAESKIDKQDLVDSIGDGFKKLVSLGPTDYSYKASEYGIQLYEKIPTLRYSYLMNYAEFCAAKYLSASK